MARDKKCPQCAEMIKAEAAVCRFCGHNFPPEAIAKAPMSKAKGCLIAVGVLFGVGVIGSVVGRAPGLGNTSGNGASPAAESTMSPQRKLQIDTAELAGRAIKRGMRNPDSLVIESGAASHDGRIVCVEYRAQNGFGGMSRESVAFQDGKPRQGSAFWNKHCTGTMDDVTYVVKSGTELPF